MSRLTSVGQEGTFLGHLGGILQSDDGSVQLTLRPEHLNPNGTVHGGVLLTLLDFTLGVTVERSLAARFEGAAAPEGHPITIQLSTSMIGAATLGETVVGTATVDAASKTMSFVSGSLVAGARTLATATAVFRNPRPTATATPAPVTAPATRPARV